MNVRGKRPGQEDITYLGSYYWKTRHAGPGHRARAVPDA
ncbi:hypothetical protein BN844_0609 [Pseudomonas sp. SHC52]|nr:hypothetical protein BN844_0609 [Pseudomonas sp. SHC52]